MDTLIRYLLLFRFSAWPGKQGIARPTARHFLVSFLMLLGLPLLLIYHAIGFALDELLFRGYRREPIEQPLFVLGPPRSGTTTVHEALAEDSRYTTFSTWECLFGLSVTWRRFWMAVGRVDQRIGRPLGRLADTVTRWVAGGFDDIHPVDLKAPEEDYFALLPQLWCFLLIVPFPDAPWLWRWGRFDEALTPKEKERIMASYRRAIQRHLHANPGKRYLAKNAAFAPLVHSLLETFPDARVVCCMRAPRAALSSQLSCLHPSLESFHGAYDRKRFGERMTGLYGFYYRNLLDGLTQPGQHRVAFLPLPALASLDRAIRDCCALLGIDVTPEHRERLVLRSQRLGPWRSGHQHDPATLPVRSELVDAAFEGLDQRFDFHGDRVQGLQVEQDELARVAGL
ncbi:MAG: sulfotransferase [Pseudomonadota bacterium]